MENLGQKNADRPFILGITGGIGSGKSTVCRIMESYGVDVFYADVAGKHILQTNPEAIREVIAEFGPESYDDDGILDRARIASIVFADDDKLAKLNSIVHPRVREEFKRFLEDHRSNRLVVHESAIIFEAGLQNHFDAVVVVDAPLGERVKWAMAGGLTEEAFQARLTNQMSAEDLRERADYIVFNTGSIDDLEEEVEMLLRGLLFTPRDHG